MLPSEQILQIKKQVISQIDSTFPENKKQEAIQQINSMNEEQLEQFLIQNNLIKNSKSVEQSFPSQSQCIFCSIISGQAESYKIDENKSSIAVLEINPISKGHSLIIPKEHLDSGDKLPQNVFSLAKKIAKKLKSKFKPKDVAIFSANVFGHEMVNVLPVYKNESMNSPRQQAIPEELEKLKKQLEKKSHAIKKSKAKKIDAVEKEKLWLPKRIP